MRHPGLLIAWGMSFASFALGCVLVNAGEKDLGGFFVGMPFFANMVLAVVTYFRVKRNDGVVTHVALYRALVGSLLASATVTFVASGSTIVASARSPVGVVGLISLGAVNVAIAILAWRALVSPTARRAAGAGMIAVVCELFAMIPDILLDVKTRELPSVMWTAIAIFAAIISMGTGALACIASLVAFRPRDQQALPTARVT